MSLSEALARADDFVAIYGDTPGEAVAVIEYLLALLYAAGCRPGNHTEWRRWADRNQPFERAVEWLKTAPDDRWNLFDPVAPLGQNSDLRPYLDKFGVGPAQLIIERAGDYNQFFDHHHLHRMEPIPADVAWRALLTQHAYGLGGRAMLKAKEMGLPAAMTNQAAGRLEGRIRVLAQGETLGDTLRWNLRPGSGEVGTLNSTWTERLRRTFARTGAAEARVVDGPADLHSVLGRSIIMRPAVMPDGTLGVDRVLMAAGEILAPLSAPFLDDMVTVESSPGKHAVFKPSPDRDLWRESHALYAAVAERAKGADLYGRLAQLSGRRVQLWAVGLVTNRTKVITWVADSFPYRPGREPELRHASEAGSKIAEYTAKALYRAACKAQESAYPNAKPTDKPDQTARFNAGPELWGAAASAFHVLLDTVVDGGSPDDALTVYGRHIRRTAVTALTARLDTLPPSGQGLKSRAVAQKCLSDLLDNSKAPYHLKDAAAYA